MGRHDRSVRGVGRTRLGFCRRRPCRVIKKDYIFDVGPDSRPAHFAWSGRSLALDPGDCDGRSGARVYAP